jgi:energy-converting hydrogenase Eha subunit E
MQWAYWPAGALGVFGVFLFFQSQIYLLSYVAAAALIGVGVFIILRSLRSEG